MTLHCRASLVSLLKHLAKVAPKMLKRREPEFDALLALWLGPELAAELLATLNKLRLELVPQHADDKPLVNAFWDDLVCEAAANSDVYLAQPQTLGDLVDRFGDRWKRPLARFEAVYSIDNLVVGEDPILLHGVEFFAPSDEGLAERRISKWRDGKEGTFTLASVDVEAADSTTAVETGRRQVIDAVALMRAAALCGVAGKTLDDDSLQWKLSIHCIVRQVAAAPSEWVECFCRQGKPLILDLGHHIRQGIGDLWLELLSDLPEDIYGRVFRAIYWLAHSVTHEAEDHKVVDLCTALEILLLPEGRKESNKGTVIALRYNLLVGDANPNPKWLYDRRNDVVHGNQLPVVGPIHTFHLRLFCYKTIELIVRSSGDQPDVSTLQGLIENLETEERLEAFLHLAKIRNPTGSPLPALVEEAKKKLKELGSIVE